MGENHEGEGGKVMVKEGEPSIYVSGPCDGLWRHYGEG